MGLKSFSLAQMFRFEVNNRYANFIVKSAVCYNQYYSGIRTHFPIVKVHGAKNIKLYGEEMITIKNPSALPERSIIQEMYEPFVIGTIITPGNTNKYQPQNM